MAGGRRGRVGEREKVTEGKRGERKGGKRGKFKERRDVG